MLPRLNIPGGERQMLMQFGGYNHTPLCREGEWYDEMNMCSEFYPVMSTARKMDVVRKADTNYNGITAKDALVLVDGTDVIYNGETVDMSDYISDDGPKQFASMGAYLLIWPDKAYLNVHDFNDKGCLDNVFDSTGATGDDLKVRVTLCDPDGVEYDRTPVTDAVAPLDPGDGDYWVDNSNPEVPVLKQWNEGLGWWVQIPTTYVKLTASYTDGGVTHKISDGFSQFDGVTVAGLGNSESQSWASRGLAVLNTAHVIYAVGDGWIVIDGIVSGARSWIWPAGVKVSRKSPDMDYVTECDNRIWGCKYGLVDDKPVNEIYASALGDFKNWNRFQGLATDSYAAGRGGDGPFTGAITHLGHPLFFRENCIEKVYPSASGAHQIVVTQGRGVQEGCWRSLAIVHETLYYKSRKDVCAYTGSLPVGVGAALGDGEFSDARAGAAGDLYYLSMRGENDNYVFTYDTVKNQWHRIDGKDFADQYAEIGGVLYFHDGAYLRRTTNEDLPGSIPWEVTSGPIGLELAENEYISRFVIRCETEGSVKLEIRYDEETETVTSNGVTRVREKWHNKGTHACSGLGSFVLPVAPRRCDHLRIRISGAGAAKIYSVAKYVERGSDVHW